MSIFGKTRHFPCASSSRLRLQSPMLTQQEWKHSGAAEGGEEESPSSSFVEIPKPASSPAARWKKVDSRALGLRNNGIQSSAFHVLKILKGQGFGAYLVGGCVRDLLLHKKPKDFDVVTTGDLRKIRKLFHRTSIIGRRFPICLVHFKDSHVEVSSFKTTGENAKERLTTLCSPTKIECNVEDLVRWRNCMQRDFTINSLLYDPCTSTIYDYVNGMKDIKACKVRTVIPAQLSFKEDCARILRGIRVAARLGLKFSKETKTAMLDLSSSVKSLPKARLMMEMNYMLAYGAAVPSINLLQKFKLLEILLPLHDLYLLQQAKIKDGETSTMLMELLSHMDMILSADCPSDYRLWLCLLAFHLALLQCPQDALTLWAFSSILYHGNITTALRSANENAEYFFHFVPEISGFSGLKSDELIMEDVSQFVTLIKSTIKCLVYPNDLAKAIERFEVPSPSTLVFVSKNMRRNVAELFDVFDAEVIPTSVRRDSYDINYKLLKKGDPKETRFVLGKIVSDVLSTGVKQRQKVITSNVGNSNELKQLKLSSTKGKEQTLMKSRSKEEKSQRTKISNSVSPEVDRVISKKRKECNKVDYGCNQNNSEMNSIDTEERGQICYVNKQEQSQVIMKNQKAENLMNGGTKLENHALLDNKAGREKMVKKFKPDKVGIKLEDSSMVSNGAEVNSVENETRQEKIHSSKEKKKPKTKVVIEKQIPSLPELFRS